MSSKVITSFTIDPEVIKAFTKAKGCYSKSALVEFWIKEYLKNKKGFVPITVQTQDDSARLPTRRNTS